MYANPRSLGGHVSKRHKGQSDVYNHKMKIRKERTQIREALSLAKLFVSKFAPNPNRHRYKFTQIRTYILKTRSHDLNGKELPESWFNSLRDEIAAQAPKISLWITFVAHINPGAYFIE